MIPGYGASKIRTETVASAASIIVRADLVRITGSTQIDTILSPLALKRDGVMIFLVAVDGAVVVSTSGNVLVGQTLAQNRAYCFLYAAVVDKWYIHGVA